MVCTNFLARYMAQRRAHGNMLTALFIVSIILFLKKIVFDVCFLFVSSNVN